MIFASRGGLLATARRLVVDALQLGLCCI